MRGHKKFFSLCRKNSPANGVLGEKESGKSDRSVRKGAKMWPNMKKSDRTPFADLLLWPLDIQLFKFLTCAFLERCHGQATHELELPSLWDIAVPACHAKELPGNASMEPKLMIAEKSDSVAKHCGDYHVQLATPLSRAALGDAESTMGWFRIERFQGCGEVASNIDGLRFDWRSESIFRGSTLPLGPKLLHYTTLLFRTNFPHSVIMLYITELVSNFSSAMNFLCCCKAYHVDIGKHLHNFFELIYRLCNLFLHDRIGFELIM